MRYNVVFMVVSAIQCDLFYVLLCYKFGIVVYINIYLRTD